MSNVMNFEFVLPTKIKFGEGISREIAAEIKELGKEKPLILTDKGLLKAGVVDKITEALKAGGIQYTIFDEIEPNPRDLTVQKAYEAARIWSLKHK